MDDPFAADDFREKLIRAGHDGVILDYGTPDGGKEVVAFHPTQIKSATGNQGTFDPSDPDITKATGGEVDDRGVVDLTQARETKQLQAYHKSFREEVADTAQQMGELIAQHREAGNLPMDIGTRFTTAHGRATNNPPFRVTGYYVNRRNPENDYGYHVERQMGDNPDDVEKSQIAVRNPRLEALHGPDKWAELQNSFRPFTGLSVAKAAGGSIGAEMDEQDPVQHYITAYHGSPHDFDEFDLSKIGTGEGAQAYGHGLYFAENEGVARGYRDKLAGGPLGKQVYERMMEHFGEYHPYAMDSIVIDTILSAHRNNKDIGETLRQMAATKAKSQWDSQVARAPHYAQLAEDKDFVQAMSRPFGHMYEVRINAHPDHFLDWDAPLAGQKHVIDAIDRHIGDPEVVMERLVGHQDGTGRDLYEALGGEHKASAVSQKLHEMGIKGIRYLDASSRGAGEGSRNYVVFDDKLVNVKRKYADGGVVKESDDGKEARKDRNPHDHGRSGRKTPLIIDQYPTRYMPHVGRQVMAEGGSIVKRALELASVGRRGRQRGRP
jgi:hypothetical protein